MDKDIVPELLETINTQFEQRIYESKKLKQVLKQLKSNRATYSDVNEFAIELGEILADVLSVNITVDILPDGKMYFNIADRVLNARMQKNYSLISEIAAEVQTQLNHEAGLRLKGQMPSLNQDRIDGIINRISSDDDFNAVKWLLDDPIINFSQSVVDDAIKANVDFHFEAGLAPKITRRVSGHACDWCKNLAGTYDYHGEPADFYRRHERCRCTVEYNPKDSRGIQNSHTKQWRAKQQQAKIEQRKTMNLRKAK